MKRILILILLFTVYNAYCVSGQNSGQYSPTIQWNYDTGNHTLSITGTGQLHGIPI